MKRLIAIIACLLVWFAAAASVWASCGRFSFAFDTKSGSGKHAHSHEHHEHGGAGHRHSENPLIHCAPVTDFLPSGAFSLEQDSRVKCLAQLPPAEFHPRWAQHAFGRWIHGPPHCANTETLHTYLLISVLRI